MTARLIINGQGALSNPNIALDAAKQGRLDLVPRGATGRVDSRALADARASGLSAICVTVGHVAGPGDAFARTVDEITEWDRFIAEHAGALCHVRLAADIAYAHATQRVGVIYGFQSADMLGDDPSRVRDFAERGVRLMQLSYNGRSRSADGCMVTDDQGLSPLGHDVLAQMQASRVLVDLSHASHQTCVDVLARATASVAISHTGCRALCDTPRNVSDSVLRSLAAGGGVVGLYGMPFLRKQAQPHAADLLRHLAHAIHVCGEDHVGIGTDSTLTGVDDPDYYMACLAKDVQDRRAAGVGAAGESEAVALFLPDLCGPTQFQHLADLLQANGYSSTRIDKVLGQNWMRLMRDVWGA